MPLGGAGRESTLDPGLPDAQEYAQSARTIMKSMARCKVAAYGAASCLRSEALQIERLIGVLDCTEYAILVREDSTQKHQEILKASIEPQVQELLKMAEEKQAERQTVEERMRRRAEHLQTTGTPRAENAAVRREELLLQHRERLKKEIQKLKSQAQDLEDY
ncbi:hypothetical protein CPB86DRAFT_782540 [Serendipita vermifera]|nr:hypothetical protein CPB86DRAFT_782540 [Serendipita vermifera]